MHPLQERYVQRQATFSQTAADLRAQYGRYAVVRLLAFIAGVATTIWCGATDVRLGIGVAVLLLAAFYRFVQWHQRMLVDAEHAEKMALVNEQEILALAHDYRHYPDGSRFAHPDHPYTNDLDIFGPYSLFQYTNRAMTEMGQERLAQWLSHPAPAHTVAARQADIVELRDPLDWRQQLQAHGMAAADTIAHRQNLEAWLADAPLVLGNKWLAAARWAVFPWVAAGLLGWAYWFAWPVFVGWMLPVYYILRRTGPAVDHIHRRTGHAAAMLAHYARLLAHIEAMEVHSEGLQQRQSALQSGGTAASASIARLAYIIQQLNVRYNMFAIVLNLGGLWDLQWVYKLEQWKEAQREGLPRWFDVLADIEALAGLANLAYNHPQWVFPVLDTAATSVRATALGHPLIPDSQRVCNDFSSPTRGHIKLVTGSNMAGKSTFLRSVGINMVLAQAGAPVCAQGLSMPPLQVFTSMRTQDALHENTSSFYAELKRLKAIIAAVEQETTDSSTGLPVYFLLDEILKGTNSVDRHTGSKALIRQLIQAKGGGIIATHDLELGQLEASAAGAIENLCIEVEIRDGKLFFDYTVKRGVSRSFNATLLMQEMGIRIEE